MPKKYTIFVSSTQRDLVAERARVVEAILRAGHIPVAMEYFPASPTGSWKLIIQLIDDCDYVVCLVAARYGFIPEGEEHSYTEKEFDYASQQGISMRFLRGITTISIWDARSSANFETRSRPSET